MFLTTFLAFCLFWLVANENLSPIVELPQGKFQGLYLTSRNGITFEAYLGIQYAQIPQRFAAAQPIKSIWNGLKLATDFSPHCVQPNWTSPGEIIGSEDCLYLNIYTPRATTSSKKAVLFYIHGGGFILGTGSTFGGHFLVDEDIILVTINYRLGIFGFLNLNDAEASGNMGLTDQILALQWVANNIEYFGGDKSKVTIGGESAGGASVIYLLLAQSAKGLFHNAIAFSGTALNPWAFAENTMNEVNGVAQFLKCDQHYNTIIKCLQHKSVPEIMAAQSSLAQWYSDPLVLFPPTVDVNSFLNAHPAELLASPQINHVPLMLTMNRDEGLVIHSSVVLQTPAMRNELNSDFNRIAPITFTYWRHINSKRLNNVTKKIRKFYFGSQDITTDTAQNLTNLYTDSWFMYGIHETAIGLVSRLPSVYLGVISHASKCFSLTQAIGIKKPLGIGHGDEASYIFDSIESNPPLRIVIPLEDPDDIKFSHKLLAEISNFIKFSTPANSHWKALPMNSPHGVEWFNIDLHNDVIRYKNIFADRINFWDSIYKSKGWKTEL